jgi:signal transduction histidine kinase
MATSSDPIKNKKGHPLSLREFIASNSDSFYRKLLDSPGEIRFLLDDQLRLAWSNKPARELYQKLTGKRLTHLVSVTDLLKPGELEQFFGYISQVYKGKPFRFDYEFEREHAYWVNIALFPFSLNERDVAGIYGIARDITRQNDSQKNHPEAQIEHQKEISRLILRAEEEERNRLGRELHDNVNQILAAIKIQISHCLDNYNKGRPILEQTQEHLREVIEEIRKLTHHLVMPGFSDSSLVQELKRLVDAYQNSYTIDFDISGFNEKITTSTLKEVIFRIIQEQLKNIAKHSKASKVTIRLETIGDTIRLRIEDNGIGFEPTKKRSGIGITNIFNRAELEGGKAEIITAKGKGCCLIVSIPVQFQ